MSAIPKKRVRRTKETIDNNILTAAQELIEEVGFPNLTISGIIQNAEIEPAVFYNRYKDIDDFCDKFVRIYDYWLNDSINFDAENYTPTQNLQNVLVDLVDSINSNLVMQKILAWEMSEDNETTRRTADNRERFSKRMIDYFGETLSGYDVDPHLFLAVIISGTYYLVVRKKRSKFSSIDFDTEAGIKLLKDNIRIMIKKIFENRSSENNNNERCIIAENLFKENVAYGIIKRATGLSDEELEQIKEKIA